MIPLLTSEKQIITSVFELHHQVMIPNVGDDLPHRLNAMADAFARGDAQHYAKVDFDLVFYTTAQFVFHYMPDEDLPTPDEFAKMLMGKSNAYGPEPIRRWGLLGVVIRIDSKYRRYINLASSHPDEVKSFEREHGESVYDTLLDMLGYAILGHELRKELDRSINVHVS